ncbi:MAG: SDR family oxidoreductase [Solirubrobacterales bacterium]|nr:SDR family oxidoreductase [Solirubrobacterales bacterium]
MPTQRHAEARDQRLRARFGGTHAVVTGGSAGIGLAVARRLLRCGATVTLVARDPGRLEQAAAGLGSPPGVHTLALDVADQEAVAAELPRELAQRPADLLVNCAGIAHAGRFVETDPEVFRRVTDVDYLGTVWMTHAAVPYLEGRPQAHIANVASMAALEGVYGYAAYAPAKFAVLGFSQVLRAELRPRGIGVSVLLPPNTDTEQLSAELEQLPDEMRPIHATSKVLAPDAVAESLLAGVCSGRFEIIPGRDNRVLDRVHRISHRPLRTGFDLMVRRELQRRGRTR